MSGVDTTLQRQLGVKPQVDMAENVIWFKWEKPEPLDPALVYAAVTDGGMGLQSFKLLAEFSFENGLAKTPAIQDLEYTGEARPKGAYAVEISGYEFEGERCKVVAVGPSFEPKVFNPDK